MQSYIGTKIVFSKPMTLGEYNTYRGWVMPKNEDPDRPGQLVEYLDGGPANHPGHENFISWSPKDVFDKGYLEIPNITHHTRIEPHVLHMLAEQVQLTDRIHKLQAFTATKKFSAMKDQDKSLLQMQEQAMLTYSMILQDRINKLV